MSGEGKQRRDNNESVKTIEIDVGQGQPWFGLGEIKGTVEKTQEVLRQVLKNYF